MLGKLDMKRSLYQFSVMCFVSVMIMVAQWAANGTPMNKTLPGLFIMTCAAMLALLGKDLFPKSIFPAFGWATIIGLLLTMPYNPVSVYVNTYTNDVSFMAITTPILAFAGISVGNKITDLKRMSWRILVISAFVFTTIFFACAGIAHIVLTIQGVI